MQPEDGIHLREQIVGEADDPFIRWKRHMYGRCSGERQGFNLSQSPVHASLDIVCTFWYGECIIVYNPGVGYTGIREQPTADS